MGRLEMALLGAPAIRHDGRELTFPTRKALALLVSLAVEGGLHSREKLAALLWPDSDEQHGRAMLRYTVAALRRAFGDAHDAQHLAVTRDTIGLVAGSDLKVDVHAVRAARLHRSTETENADMASSSQQTIADLRALVACYRGEFLEGFSLPDAPAYDDWASGQRESARQSMERVLDRLSKLEVDAGESTEALRTVGRWLATNRLSEEGHRRLMRLHLAAGDRAAALRAFEACRALLQQELAVSPAPETESLAAQIRIAAVSRPGRSHAPPSPSIPPGYVEGPLVGRSDEFARLVERYHAVRRDGAQVVILEGEAGIGKTRLASEFLGWAVGQGADVLQGRAFETGGRLPYQPLVDALRPRVERENAPDDLLSDVWLTELGRLLPELRDRYPDLPVPAGDEAAARTRLFEAIARLGQALAQRAPTVLFVDDLQWSDTGSLDVLHYAGRRWVEGRTPLLLLFGLRSESLVATPALEEWLAGLRRSLAVSELHLDPLRSDDMLRFVRGLVAGAGGMEREAAPAVEALARWLFDETDGQPLFAVEIIRTLVQRRLLGLRPSGDGGWAIELAPDTVGVPTLGGIPPPGIQEVIRDRLMRLGPTTRDILAAAAVLGQGFGFEHLCQVAGVAEDDALRATDEVLRSHLLRETEAEERQLAPGSYVFTHDKIREVVYAGISDARRRVFHQRALNAMQAAPPAELARHAMAAGLDELAAGHSIVAGDDAMRLLAGRDAIAHYERAIAITERLGRAGMRAELHARCGKAYASVALWAQARRELEAALTNLGPDQQRRRAEIQADLLEACWWLLDMASLRRVATEVLATATTLRHGALETAALGWLAAAVGADGDVEGCVARCRSTLSRARALGVPAPPHVHTYISLSLYWLGRLDESIERSRAGVEAARANHHVSAMMWCLPHLGIALAASGRYDEADRTFEEARRIGRESGTTALLARAIAMSAGFRLDLEDFASHEALAEEAREMARSLSFPPPAVSAGIDLLLNFARRRDVGRAERLIDEVAATVEATAGFHGWLWRLRLAEARAELALARGDYEETLACADETIRQSRARRRVKYHAIARDTRARALIALGRTREAIHDLRAAVGCARSIGDPALFIRTAAGLLAVDGDDTVVTEARAAVERIARALADEGVRRRFEATESVRSIFESRS